MQHRVGENRGTLKQERSGMAESLMCAKQWQIVASVVQRSLFWKAIVGAISISPRIYPVMHLNETATPQHLRGHTGSIRLSWSECVTNELMRDRARTWVHVPILSSLRSKNHVNCLVTRICGYLGRFLACERQKLRESLHRGVYGPWGSPLWSIRPTCVGKPPTWDPAVGQLPTRERRGSRSEAISLSPICQHTRGIGGWSGERGGQDDEAGQGQGQGESGARGARAIRVGA